MQEDVINEIEQEIVEYIERQGYQTGQKIPNAVISGAIANAGRRYVAPRVKNADQGEKAEILRNAVDLYIDLCERFNVVSFIFTFCRFIGITEKEYNRLNNNYKQAKPRGVVEPVKKCRGGGAKKTNSLGHSNKSLEDYNNINFAENEEKITLAWGYIFESLKSYGKTAVRHRLADDRVGVVALANNDPEIGLEYTKNNRIAEVEIAKSYRLTDIKSLLENKNNQGLPDNGPKNDEITSE